MIKQTRSFLRATLREQRKHLSQALLHDHSQRINQHLVRSDYFKHSQHIAAYIAFEGEVNTSAIIGSIWQAHKKCYLPMLQQTKECHLDFLAYHENDTLNLNRFGIPEPIYNAKLVFPVTKLDLILMPLVACDRQGNRLGMGAGYYDRSLAFKCDLDPRAKPLLIGLAHSFQMVEYLSPEPWDVPLNGVITENGLIEFN